MGQSAYCSSLFIRNRLSRRPDGKIFSCCGALGFLFFFFSCIALHAQQGKDGAKIINTNNTVVNEYTSLTADAGTGNTFIKVNNSNLNTNSRFTSALSKGDLLMIIQMQGATINGTATDSTWGAITSYNNCGLYEFSEVLNAPDGSTINLSCALKNNYTASGRTQVVRVPRFTTLTVNAFDTLTCDPWDSAVGGIVAIETKGSAIVNAGGAVDASGKGFRGGPLISSGTNYNITGYAVSSADFGAAKGEGIAGFLTDYAALYGGGYGRGAPANGGGGGNAFDASGGGGANAGNINAWTGNGNPDISDASWVAAWNLEYNGFAYSTSSGGGRGGYSFGWSDLNALVDPPGDPSWSGDSRHNLGGKGGRPLDYSTGRIFMGGGGGAGQQDNNDGSGGANGGGLVYLLCYGDISGNGTIISNGGTPPNSTGGFGYNGDGAGGAGAGGTIILYSAGTLSGITAVANGGTGANQIIPGGNESEGPGGGGGGGYIATSGGQILQYATGGANGYTNSPAVTEFIPDGATRGGNGLVNQPIDLIPASTLLPDAGANVDICVGDDALLTASGGVTYSWSPSTSLSCDSCATTTANPIITTTYVVTVSNGSCTGIDSVVVNVTGIRGNAGNLTVVYDTICQYMADTVLLTGSSGIVQWQSSADGIHYTDIDISGNTFYPEEITQTVYYRTYAGAGTCADTSKPAFIWVNPLPQPPVLTAGDSIFCSGDSTGICSLGRYRTYLWNTGSADSCIIANTAGAYWLTVTDANNCSVQSAHQLISIYPVPSVSIIIVGDTLESLNSRFYQWYYNDNRLPADTNAILIAPGTGYYSVAIIDSDGCTALSTNTHIIATGINGLAASADWNIYPNPVGERLFIKNNSSLQIKSVEIFDLPGQIVLSIRNAEALAGIISIDASALARGTYYLWLKTETGNFVQKVAKE